MRGLRGGFWVGLLALGVACSTSPEGNIVDDQVYLVDFVHPGSGPRDSREARLSATVCRRTFDVSALSDG
jgi:hypothetical protein